MAARDQITYSAGGGEVEDNSNPSIFIIRFTLKAIANITSTQSSSQHSSKLERAFKGKQLGADLLVLASQDELVGFYTNMLSGDLFS